MREALAETQPTVSIQQKWIIVNASDAAWVDPTYVRAEMVSAKKAYAFLHLSEISTEVGRQISTALPELFVRYRYQATREDLLDSLTSATQAADVKAVRSLDPDQIEEALQLSYFDVLNDPTRCPGFQPSWPPAISALARTSGSACFLIDGDLAGAIVASTSAAEDDTGKVVTTNWVWVSPHRTKAERTAIQAQIITWLLEQDTDEYRASVNLENFRSAKFHENCGYQATCFLIAEN